jgi:hypothetical protein
MRRLRPLSEKECYLRCYGASGDPTVRVLRLGPPPPRPRVARITGEELRRLFELRLDAREPELAA